MTQTIHDQYAERYRDDFVKITTPRDVALKREHAERENKFKESVRQLFEKIQLK